MRHSPGRGLGLFAKQAIPVNTILFREKSLFTYPDIKAPKFLETIYNGLDTETRHLFDELKQIQGYTNVEEAIKINKFWYELEPNIRGVYIRASRFNHSFNPNVMTRTSQEDIAEKLAVSVKDIPAGHEATMCYTNEDLLYEGTTRRQEIIRAVHGFECSCCACTATGLTRQESDRRRKQLQICVKIINDHKENPRSMAKIPEQVSRKAVDLFDQEDLKTVELPMALCSLMGCLERREWENGVLNPVVIAEKQALMARIFEIIKV